MKVRATGLWATGGACTGKYFTRELATFAMEPSDEMPVVCERFEVVYLPA
jgi:hypothetical protein